MGTPDIAAECLTALIRGGRDIIGVVTQPDKPKGRGNVMTPPPAKTVAQENGIPVYQPQTLRSDEWDSCLRGLDPDIIVVVAYGKLLPHGTISYPKYGCINLHASLLPKYRGAAPIQRAIMCGERVTGVTVMMMDDGLDTGDMLMSEKIEICPCDDCGTLKEKIADVGSRLLCTALDDIAAGRAVRTPQSDSCSCYAEKITKEDCKLDFTKSAKELCCIVRGLSPAPLACCRMPDGRMLKIAAAEPTEGSGVCGEVISADGKGEGSFTVACGEGALRVKAVVPEGKGMMSAGDFVRGRKINVKDVLC